MLTEEVHSEVGHWPDEWSQFWLLLSRLLISELRFPFRLSGGWKTRQRQAETADSTAESCQLSSPVSFSRACLAPHYNSVALSGTDRSSQTESWLTCWRLTSVWSKTIKEQSGEARRKEKCRMQRIGKIKEDKLSRMQLAYLESGCFKRSRVLLVTWQELLSLLLF